MTTLAVDTETHGLRWHAGEDAFLAQWSDGTSNHYTVLKAEDREWRDAHGYGPEDALPMDRETFQRALDGADTLLFANAPFDRHQLRTVLGYDPAIGKEVHDVSLSSRVLHPQEGDWDHRDLESLAKRWHPDGGTKETDALREVAKRHKIGSLRKPEAHYKIWKAEPEVLEHYALMDAKLTFDLHPIFLGEMDAGQRRVYELERQVQTILTEAERIGVRCNQQRVSELKVQYERESEALYAKLVSELGEAALGGAGSKRALPEALLRLGVPLTKLNPSAEGVEPIEPQHYATNKFALEPFEHDYPVIRDLFELRRVNKFLSTYIAAYEGQDVIHPTFKQAEARTSRMSCTNPNLQNIPKRAGVELRSVMVPREGHSFVVIDYESIEVRMLAYYLGSREYRRLVGELDSHAWMASNIWGGKPSDYFKGTAGEPLRKLAKNILFAIIYGAGDDRVVAMLVDAGIDAKPGDGTALIRKITSALPGYKRLKSRVEESIALKGYISTIFGRHLPTHKGESYKGLNKLIQGSAAEVMKQGLVYADQLVRPLGGVPLLVVHDELVIEVPTENAAEAYKRAAAGMCAAADIQPPLSVEGGIVETSYADA